MATMRTRSVTALLALGLLGLGPASSATPSDQVPPRSFTIAATGDVMVHRSIAAVADQHTPGWNTYDFSPMLAAIEPWISGADLAICQMEMTMSATNQGLSYYPRFVVPHELADAVAGAGFDACSTASNHSIDGGMETLSQTIELLAAVGVATTGTARTPDERLPNLYEVNGVTVGHMAYTYSLNGLTLPEPWAVNVIDEDAILSDARWAREHGAEFVILSIHWGNEYQSAPSTWQIALAERLTASPDIDLILGHHVHVVQPIGIVNGKVVVYGMSNFISNIRGSAGERVGAEDGIVVHLAVVEQDGGGFAVESLEYTPVWIDPATKAVVPVGHALLAGVGPTAALQTSWDRTVYRVNRLGPSGAVPTADPWPAVSCRGRLATIVGTPDDDVIVGTDGDDVIVGRGGNDSIWAGSGDDLVCGGEGDDFISSGEGTDRLEGEDGDDVLMGYGGDDVLWGGDGDDVLSGGEGADLLVGGPGDDSLRGGPGGDILWGGNGDDRSDAGPDDSCVAAGCS